MQLLAMLKVDTHNNEIKTGVILHYKVQIPLMRMKKK
jgi:hypothetical protein